MYYSLEYWVSTTPPRSEWYPYTAGLIYLSYYDNDYHYSECPWGLKAVKLLQERELDFEEIDELRSREEVDELKAKYQGHDVNSSEYNYPSPKIGAN